MRRRPFCWSAGVKLLSKHLTQKHQGDIKFIKPSWWDIELLANFGTWHELKFGLNLRMLLVELRCTWQFAARQIVGTCSFSCLGLWMRVWCSILWHRVASIATNPYFLPLPTHDYHLEEGHIIPEQSQKPDWWFFRRRTPVSAACSCPPMTTWPRGPPRFGKDCSPWNRTLFEVRSKRQTTFGLCGTNLSIHNSHYIST